MLPLLSTSEPVGWSWEERFRVQLETFCTLAASEGIRLTPYHPQRPFADFRLLPQEAQAAIVQNFQVYLNACLRAKADGESIRDDSRVVLWGILRHLGLRPSSDLFERLQTDDVIEVYGSDLIQIYRNLRFLELCTYPLDQIFSCAWPDLFQRPSEFTESVLKDIGQILGGKVRHTIDLDSREHVVQETCSEERRKFGVRHGIMSPLFGRSGAIEGFVATLRAGIVVNG